MRDSDHADGTAPGLRRLAAEAVRELTGRRTATETEAIEEESGAEAEIESAFRRRISGLRFLPRRDRAAALWAARIWKAYALRALREQRARTRHAEHFRKRLQVPVPS